MLARRLFLTCTFLTVAVPSGWAQTAADGSARSVALAGATTALSQHVSGTANPASWATFSARALSFFASEAFGLAALRIGAATYIEPTRFATLAAGAKTFGFDDYRETTLQAGVAHSFHPSSTRPVHLGVNVRYHRIAIPAYGHTGALLVDLGGLVDVFPSVQVGFHATNLRLAGLAGSEDTDRTLSLGIGYAPDERVLLVVDAYKDLRFPLSIRAGVELHVVPVLFLRAGAATEPARVSAGTGLRLGKIAADVAAERHEVLGWSPAVSLGLHW